MTFRASAFLAAAVLLCVPLRAHAQQHEPLARRDSLAFQEILEATVRNAPESLEAPVRRAQADTYAASGRSWMAGRASLSLNYYDDAVLDDSGQREAQYGLQVPLWRPGERRDAARLGASYEAQLDSWEAALMLDLAGRVRAALADIHEAEVLLGLEREATATAEEVVRVSEMQFAAGALARLDVMQSRNLLLEQQRREFAADAALVDSEISYQFLTGLHERPTAPHTEAQAAETEVSAAHPLLHYLQSEIDVLDGAVRQSEVAAKGNPLLMVGTRRERADRFSPYTDSVNIALTIPLGGSAFVASRTSAARREKVDAEVRYRNTLRALELALHDAEHELFIVRQELPLAREQAALGVERQMLAQTAFAQGELTLAQVLLAIQEARAATRELALLEAREQRLITEFNQFTGVLP